MWHQPDKNRWKWYCQVVWEPLGQEQAKHPEDSMLAKSVSALKAAYGEDLNPWPKLEALT